MHWKNWSESVDCNPFDIRYPTTEDSILTIMKDCQQNGRKLRVVGSGHSFTALVQTDGVIMSLERYQGFINVDKDAMQVTMKAGTTIRNIGQWLFEIGMAQENLGDIDEQSIAGAISTGTHGSGIHFGNLSTQVVGLRLITANGEIIDCSETDRSDIFKAAQISLGALGIISEVTLRVVPRFALDFEWKVMPLKDCLANLEHYKQTYRNFEFYWLPYTEKVMCKFMNVTDQDAQGKNFLRRFQENVVENAVLYGLSEVARLRPALSKTVCKILSALVTSGRDVQYGHRIFATVRAVKFQEMEYNLPAENFTPCLLEIVETIERKQFQVNFPLECRWAQRDDIFLSPAYERDSAYIAIHMYKGMAFEDYFHTIEAIFKKYAGRPHWGKMHHRTPDELAQLYPKWEAFHQIRQQLDPDGFFLNPYLERLFVS